MVKFSPSQSWNKSIHEKFPSIKLLTLQCYHILDCDTAISVVPVLSTGTKIILVQALFRPGARRP